MYGLKQYTLEVVDLANEPIASGLTATIQKSATSITVYADELKESLSNPITPDSQGRFAFWSAYPNVDIVVAETAGGAYTFSAITPAQHVLHLAQQTLTVEQRMDVVEVLASAKIMVGNASGVMADVAMSGDATIDNAGALTIAALAVETGMLAGGAVTAAKVEALADGEVLIGVDGTAANNAKVTVSGDGLLANDGVLTATHGTIWPMGVMGTLAIDGDGAETNGGGLWGGSGVTLSEQAAALCVVVDYDGAGSDYQLLSTSSSGGGYTANYQLLPDTEIENDAVYFGGAVAFCELALDITTVATYAADSIIWEYWDGDSWETLTIVQDQTDADDADGDRPFQRDGAIHFVPPADWAASTINTQEAYWIRARCTATVNVTQTPTTASKEHELVTPTDGFVCPHAGTITAIRLHDYAATLHTTADVKFCLVNITTGAATAALTFAQDIASDYWASLTLAVNAADVLALLITQEDGANEVVNAQLELYVTLS